MENELYRLQLDAILRIDSHVTNFMEDQKKKHKLSSFSSAFSFVFILFIQSFQLQAGTTGNAINDRSQINTYIDRYLYF